MQIQIDLPHVKIGIVEADDVRVAPADSSLTRLMDEVCFRLSREYTLESLAEADSTHAVRAMFRAWGIDPSKYRPSSEALLRRVVQGKGLYRVLNIVDIGNVGSIETSWPYGCYDRSRIHPPVTFRAGQPSETYDGIGKRTWHLDARPVLADLEGPFGSPISDSTRTMITESAVNALAVIYAPSGSPAQLLDAALARLQERCTQYARASTTRSFISV